MCVQTKGFAWERPAIPSDFQLLAARFPSVDFLEMHTAMSVYGFRPLTTDLVLLAALLESTPDEFGIRSVPFAGLDKSRGVLVKTDAMLDIIGWMENTALGYRMWRSVSAWCERVYTAQIEFTMECSCSLVPLSAYEDGSYESWLTSFNVSRHNFFGRSYIVYGGNGADTDMTSSQHLMWGRIREALLALPRYDEVLLAVAA